MHILNYTFLEKMHFNVMARRDSNSHPTSHKVFGCCNRGELDAGISKITLLKLYDVNMHHHFVVTLGDWVAPASFVVQQL
ncbi:hypothetical protein Tco_0488529 [Tanacetum coccineum]